MNGSPPPAASRTLYALLRIDGAQAFVQASSDGRLLRKSVPWPGDTSRVPKATLQALDFELATHTVFEASGRRWAVVLGARGNDPLVVSDTIPAPAVQLIGELAEQLCASESHAAPFTGLSVEPIVDVRSQTPVRAQLLLPDASAETLHGALKHARGWTSYAFLHAVHISVDVDDDAHVQRYVDAIAQSEPALRTMLAIDLRMQKKRSFDVTRALAAFAHCGVETGVALDDATILDITRLTMEPLAYVKLPATNGGLRLAKALPWQVFAANCDEARPWRVFELHNVRFVQGLAIQPAMPVHEYERWMQTSAYDSARWRRIGADRRAASSFK